MKIEKIEKIFLSQEEVNTWTKFFQILEEIKKESGDEHILKLVGETLDNISDLWEEVDE